MALGKMVLPFLVCLLLLAFLAEMFHNDVTSGASSTLSNSMASDKIGVYASLASLRSFFSTKASSLLEEWQDKLRYNSSMSIRSTPSALSASSLTSILSSNSGSSAVAQTLHTEGKETMLCPPSCFRPDPVCGTDGVTYWCGSMDAECAGVEVDYEGFCDFDSKGTGVKGVLAMQSLLLVHMVWLMLAAFMVFLGVI